MPFFTISYWSCSFDFILSFSWSFASAVGQGSWSPLLIDFILLTVIGFIASQNHSGFSRVFRIIVPNRLVICRHFSLHIWGFNWLFLFPSATFAFSQNYAALVVVQVEAWILFEIPFELLGWLKVSLLPPFHPRDHWLCIPMGLETFLGLSIGGLDGVSLPAGLSSIA